MLRSWNLIEIYFKSVNIENVSQFHCGCARTLESQYIRIKIKDLNDVKIDVGPLAQLPSPPTLRTPPLKLARVKPRLT